MTWPFLALFTGNSHFTNILAAFYLRAKMIVFIRILKARGPHSVTLV